LCEARDFDLSNLPLSLGKSFPASGRNKSLQRARCLCLSKLRMALEEYKRKRDFKQTPEPPPKVGKGRQRRFVVQKHRATRLHYDFRLEMEGVLKSWAVPKGPSLDPADKRLAMQVEDHPVSYFDFEGTIPGGNYGAGTVMVWDMGTWEPQGNAAEMLAKGDLKFRLDGQKLKGDFALVHIKSHRPGTKGTEWLLIKHRDAYVQEGYDIEQFDYSVLTKRTMDEIAGDAGSAEWTSSRKVSTTGSSRKNDWLADSIAKADAKRARTAKKSSEKSNQTNPTMAKQARVGRPAKPSAPDAVKKNSVRAPALAKRVGSPAAQIGHKAPMPRVIHPMLATLVDGPFDDQQWLYEIKWDGYRAIAFLDGGAVRLVSRNQNDLTAAYPELHSIGDYAKARTAILDGEIVALDEQGRPSFSLMQQRTGIGAGGHRIQRARDDVPVVYYVFDLLYLDGYNLMNAELEQRKELLASILAPGGLIRYSDHYVGNGKALFAAAAERELEGIVAKRRRSQYLQKRSREWLKLKIVRRQECVIGGYTDPRGSRENFGSVVLGLYDDEGRLIHVGHAGSGFTEESHAALWKRLHSLDTRSSPFFGKVESTRSVHFVKPELVAEIKFTEWTHEGPSRVMKMRAPVFEGLRFDKKPEECRFERPASASAEVKKAEAGDAA
jgi:bifunctional non-homologous end joining protein LigD